VPVREKKNWIGLHSRYATSESKFPLGTDRWAEGAPTSGADGETRLSGAPKPPAPIIHSGRERSFRRVFNRHNALWRYLPQKTRKKNKIKSRDVLQAKSLQLHRRPSGKSLVLMTLKNGIIINRFFATKNGMWLGTLVQNVDVGALEVSVSWNLERACRAVVNEHTRVFLFFSFLAAGDSKRYRFFLSLKPSGKEFDDRRGQKEQRLHYLEPTPEKLRDVPFFEIKKFLVLDRHFFLRVYLPWGYSDLPWTNGGRTSCKWKKKKTSDRPCLSLTGVLFRDTQKKKKWSRDINTGRGFFFFFNKEIKRSLL
jgi:hypothetical protein